MPLDRIPIGTNAEALFIESDRFNTSNISFNFYLPLKKETIAENALIPFMLTTCGKNYPDFSRLNFTLSKLYGANLFASAEKIGDLQLLKVGISVIDDRFALDGENISEKATELLFDLIFEPKVTDGAFCSEDLEREKRRAIEHIKGEMSDKRLWSKHRLIEEMFKGDSYGCSKCGTVEQVSEVTGESLYKAWQNMLSNAFIRVNVISKSDKNLLGEKLISKFAEINRTEGEISLKSRGTNAISNPNTVTEYMDIAQGKLCMGFTAGVFGGDKETSALTVMCDIFGGGPYSRLFTVVREKMSLCYYCSSTSVKVKGIICVSSGIELKNAQKAQSAILDQLDIMKRGQFTDEEFESSKKSIVDSFSTFSDSQSTLDTWYSIKIADDMAYTPKEAAEFINSVTREDVERVARSVKLHTVYKLLPKEKA